MAYGEYTTLLIDQQGAVLKVTVDRPHVLNAQSRVMREEFDEVLDIAAEDDDVRVVIVAASGDHFSAGHDLGSAEEMADREQRPSPRRWPAERRTARGGCRRRVAAG